MPGLAALLGRLGGRADDELVGEEERHPSLAEDVRPVVSCLDRERVTVEGALLAVAQEQAAASSRFTAELDDGTGSVWLVWMGRREIAGIEVGRRLRAEGRLSRSGAGRTIYNPRYELLP